MSITAFEGHHPILEELRLYHNDLEGNIPNELGNLSNLKFLYLYNNNNAGQLSGPIPETLGNLANLEHLYLHGNLLEGVIPTSLGQLSKLEILSLNNNQLTGAIPKKLGDLNNLTHLYLNNNQLTGAIPSELGRLTKLIALRLSDTELSGPIPLNFTNLTEVIADFRFQTTQICEPNDPALQAWLSEAVQKPEYRTGVPCLEMAYYSFDGNADDMSGNGHNGQWFGKAEYANGKIGQAASFDGSGNYIQITPQEGVSPLKDFTIAVWVYLADWKPNTQGEYRQYIFDMHSDEGQYTPGFYLVYDKKEVDEIHMGILYEEEPLRMLERRTDERVKKQWHFITFKRVDDKDYVYVDGVEIHHKETDWNDERDDRLDIQHNWYIGTFGRNLDRYPFYDLIDELRIYNYALPDEEIQTLYEAAQ